ncbi:DNA gyrase inhibitor YacG [Xanthobacter sp. TB0139]|uniref:DNA gyrase inhibitor YacG n=1 Tax=Xanthobacter sp. TB0139 TaxID=3459178 RepID=UPI0040393867
MSGTTDKTQESLTGRPCPICGKPGVHAYRPFCSKRCADVDLNRWLSGSYAIPVTEEEDEDGERPVERAPVRYRFSED